MNKITPRTWAFLFAGIALLALVLLSASLSGLEMSSGRPLSYFEIAPQLVDASMSPGTTRTVITIFRVLMILGWIILPFYIIMLFVSKDERKRLLRFLASVAPFIIFLYIMSNSMSTREGIETLNPDIFGDSEMGNMSSPGLPPPEFVPPPPWVTTFTTIVIAFIITLILMGIFFAIWRRSQDRLKLQPLKKMERQAQDALDSIRSGGDLSETIQRCYIQMIQALKEYRGLNRELDVTPHEFEAFLGKHGVPGEPVHQLTRLFEEVRYGGSKPGRSEEQVAIASLSAIISACQRAAQKRG